MTSVTRSILIDNYDSYTYNLYQLIAQVNGVAPKVFKNDEIKIEDLKQMVFSEGIASIVISPGPGSPDRQRDIGICLDIFKRLPEVPIFGVCLGFQSLCLAYGGSCVERAEEPVHGRLSVVFHNGDPLFEGIPSGDDFEVVRYHSLCVNLNKVGDEVVPLAWANGKSHHVVGTEEPSSHGSASMSPGCFIPDKAILMGARHTRYPHFGVQFHPESVATRYGFDLLRNFKELTALHWSQNQNKTLFEQQMPVSRILQESNSVSRTIKRPNVLHMLTEKIENCLESISGGTEAIIEALFCPSSGGSSDLFWLDSSSTERARFSFFGGRGGSLWRRISYSLCPSGHCTQGGILCETSILRTEEQHVESIWEWISLQTQVWEIHQVSSVSLPFEFHGGIVGYLGYELKGQCGGSMCHAAITPDACFFIVDRYLAVDHSTGDLYVVALHDENENDEVSQQWINEIKASIKQIPCRPQPHEAPSVAGNGPCGFIHRHDERSYKHKIDKCLEALHAGDSYELCLTNMIEYLHPLDGWLLYKKLRSINPAPYACFLDFSATHNNVGPVICCSSPERFLRGQMDGSLEAKPIKGTAKRDLQNSDKDRQAAMSLYRSEKDRAENLMIVDLLRNDLGKVCELGSVHVPSLMQIESYATVHQMVSTIRGETLKGLGIGAVIQAAFPGGSMTGAPKIRSMEILDALEQGPRGIYSGSIGYISWNRSFDLNIVIRTAVLCHDRIQVGAGGAIVLQSVPAAEYEEMKLKSEPILRAIAACVTPI